MGVGYKQDCKKVGIEKPKLNRPKGFVPSWEYFRFGIVSFLDRNMIYKKCIQVGFTQSDLLVFVYIFCSCEKGFLSPKLLQPLNTFERSYF